MSKSKAVNPIDVGAGKVLKSYVLAFGIMWVFFMVLEFFWGKYVLLSFDDLRAHGTSMSDGLLAVWWMFAWAFAVNMLVGVINRREQRPNEPGETLFKGWWISINAGVFEELIYRWLVFFAAMIMVPFFNWITFGLLGWIYQEALIPVANWATFGALEPQLLGHTNWVFGAAIVMASIRFRDAHKHLGFFGWVNAWFGGMVLFWLMFNYGIGTAIVAHIVYDVIVFSTMALTYTWRPKVTLDSYLLGALVDAFRRA
jgi:hypothetical protein